MKKIALVLFQLMGCSQRLPRNCCPPADPRKASKTPLENTPKAPKAREFTVSKHIGAFFLLAVGIGALSFFFISRARRVHTPKPVFIAKVVKIQLQRQERQQKDVQDSPTIKKRFDALLCRIDWKATNHELMAAYNNYSTDHMIHRLRNQTMQNKN